MVNGRGENQLPEINEMSDRIRSHLERILRSDDFKRKERLRKFLTYVVEETLAGASVIRSFNIAVEVFEKDESFDPGDPYVRNIARATRKALSGYYAGSGHDDDIRINVPAGNYIATFDEPSPPRRTLSVRDDTVELPRQNRVVEAPEPAVSSSYAAHGRQRQDSLPTVAVIPFRYHGSRHNNEIVIGEIVAGSTIRGLSGSPLFNVISRLSTTKLRDIDWTLMEVTEQLDCNYVVSGSYRCVKGEVLLHAELADCMRGEVIWADHLRTSISEILEDQDVLVEELLTQTSRAVIVQEIKRATSEPFETLALHTQMIAGLHDIHSTSEKCFNRARVRFEQVLKSHPNHAAVNAHIALWHVMRLNRNGGWNCSVEKTRSEANRYLQNALDSGPYDALALTINGLVETQFNRNPEKGLDLYNDALRYHPNEPLLYAFKAAVLSYKGEGKEAVKCAEKSLKLSPFDPQLNMFHTCAAAAYYSISDFVNAEKHAVRADSLNPQHTSNLRTLVAIQVDLGKIKEAKQSARRLLQQDPLFTTSSYLTRSPNSGYPSGRVIAERLERAGVPCK